MPDEYCGDSLNVKLYMGCIRPTQRSGVKVKKGFTKIRETCYYWGKIGLTAKVRICMIHTK